MAQQQITGKIGALGAGGSITTYQVPGSALVSPVSVTATFNGTGASGTFIPCLSFYTQTGALIARCPAPEVAAGDTAEVSWFQSVGGSSTSRNPVVANQLDYVEITSIIDCSAGTQASPVVIIQGNNVTYDGVTRVRVEAYSPHYDLSAPGGGNFLTNLFMDSTNLGRFAILNSDAGNTDLGVPYYGVRYITPSAGTHSFSIRGWTSSGSTITFEAGPGGAANQLLPGYLRVST